MSDIALIVLQAGLAVVTVRLLSTHVLRHLDRIAHPELVLEIWGPIIIVLPMIFAAGRVGPDVAGPGWLALGGPLICAMLALGLSLIVHQRALVTGSTPSVRTLLVWVGCGVVYLLLCVAHDLTVWTGQTLFAIGAVVMWMNTPHGLALAESSEADNSTGAGAMLALLCGVGQGVLVLLVGDDLLPISGGLIIAQAALVLAIATRQAGAGAAIRLGGWAATLGVLFSLGVMSIMFMVPSVLSAFLGAQPSATSKVAYGLGQYAPEAMGLILLGPMAWVGARVSPSWRRFVGIGALGAGAVLAAFRLASM